MVPKTRPMDEMALNFLTPQEDEFAPCLMSLRSLYLGISFPRSEDQYARYLTFDRVPQPEIDEWKSALVLVVFRNRDQRFYSHPRMVFLLDALARFTLRLRSKLASQRTTLR